MDLRKIKSGKIFVLVALLFSIFFSNDLIFHTGKTVKAATIYGPFTFDADNDADEAAWTFISDNGPDGLNTPDTRRAWSHDTNDTSSSGVGPTSGQGGSPDGYVYTEASSPASAGDTFHMTYNTILDASANDWTIDFYWNQRGNDNLATVAVQTNENGAGWVTRGTYATGGPDVPSGGSQVWNRETLDLEGVVSHSSTQIRFLVTLGSSGNIWNNDFALDTITISGEEIPRWPMLTDTNYTYDSNKIEFTGGYGQLKWVSSADWWNTNYPYRQKITFGTNHSTLPVGYTATFDMDTRPANTNVSLTSGNDVRIVWQPDVGADIELDRIGDTWNNAATSIDFRLQSEIGANLSEDLDGSYYVYYGYGSAGTPPTDETDVYYFADFFNRADSGTVGNGWTEWQNGGTVQLVSGVLDEETDTTGPPDSGVKQNFPLGAISRDFTVEWDWNIPVNSEGIWTVYTQIGNNMSNNARETGVAFGLIAGEGSQFSPNNNYNMNSALNNNLETNINGNQSYRLDVDFSAKTFDYYRAGILRDSNVPFYNSGTSLTQIRLANDQYASSADNFQWDNLKVYLNVDNPPEETTGTEEPYQYYPMDSPTIRPTTLNAEPFTAVSAFTTTEVLNGGSITYQVTNDGTNASPTWYYWNGSSWTAAGASDYNSAATVNTNIGQFATDVGTGDFSFRAFLNSDGSQLVKLDGVDIEYVYNPVSSRQYIYDDGVKVLIYDDGVKNKQYD